jgi:hypothetical protein
MAKPYCCKEAQAAPLHERGPAAMSGKKLPCTRAKRSLKMNALKFCYLRNKKIKYHF